MSNRDIELNLNNVGDFEPEIFTDDANKHAQTERK